MRDTHLDLAMAAHETREGLDDDAKLVGRCTTLVDLDDSHDDTRVARGEQSLC